MPQTVDTTKYEAERGRKPDGRGVWTFHYQGRRCYWTTAGHYQACAAQAVRNAEDYHHGAAVEVLP